MSDGMQLSPAELDAIEDALEFLEADGLPATYENPVDARGRAVADHLQAYREILQISREALPLEDVPAGALDGVLAEARNAQPAAVAPARSWWERFRMTVVLPAVALAGTAALLLIIVSPREPGSDMVAKNESAAVKPPEEPAAAQAAKDGRARAESKTDLSRLADASEPATKKTGEFELDDGRNARGAALAREVAEEKAKEEGTKADDAFVPFDEESPAEPEPAPALEPPPAPGSTIPTPAPSGKKKPKKTVPSATKGGKDGPKQDPTPDLPQKPADPDVSSMTDVNKGDSQRRAGQCGLARKQYLRAAKRGDNKVKARAFAGLGLCEAAKGNSAAADNFFRQAKNADPSVGAFIQRERDRAEAPRAQADEDAPK